MCIRDSGFTVPDERQRFQSIGTRKRNVAPSATTLRTMRGGEPKQEEMQALGMATVGVCYAIFWLYFLLFETFGGGRTPGKRILKLRVMSVHGGPASASAVVPRMKATEIGMRL